MKKMIRANKRKNIPKEEWNDAIEIGREIFKLMHARYPDLFPLSKPRSIQRKSSWSAYLYVLMDIGVRRLSGFVENEVGEDIEYFENLDEIIKKEILPELGISDDEFQAGIDYTEHRYRVFLYVFDLHTTTYD